MALQLLVNNISDDYDQAMIRYLAFKTAIDAVRMACPKLYEKATGVPGIGAKIRGIHDKQAELVCVDLICSMVKILLLSVEFLAR